MVTTRYCTKYSTSLLDLETNLGPRLLLSHNTANMLPNLTTRIDLGLVCAVTILSFSKEFTNQLIVPGNAYSSSRPSGPPPPPSAPQAFGHGAPNSYAFRYSNCSGRRKALLVGINYFGQRGQLRGCINDVRNMTAYLAEHFGYKREDMVILTDDQQNPMSQPTKQNILRAMHWLVKDARPNDSLFFHYSGLWTPVIV